MNFLELAQRARHEIGYSGDGPQAVDGQSGAYQKVVNWVQEALQDIHLSREQWRFDWARFAGDLVAGQASYSLYQLWGLQVRSLAADPVFVFRISDGPLQRHWVCMLAWEEFRLLASSNATGIPVYGSLSPDGRLHLHPAPMAGLAVSIDYYRDPAPLSGSQDVPRIPAHYHTAIVWRAAQLAAGHDENPALLQSASRNFAKVMARMERTELPEMQAAGPMA